MSQLLALLLFAGPAQAAEWWVETAEERAPLEEALDELWASEEHPISLGADWSADLQVIWTAGHVSRFEDGRFISRAPATSARTAVALARSWFVAQDPPPSWIPAFERTELVHLYDLNAQLDVVEVRDKALPHPVRRKREPLEVWIGPTLEFQSGVGTGFRAEARSMVGWDVEFMGWLQPTLIERAMREVSDGSWIAMELRTAAHVDLVEGPAELRLGVSLVGSDFGAHANNPVTNDLELPFSPIGGLWAGGMVRARLLHKRVRFGGDLRYRHPLVALEPERTTYPVVGRLSRFAGVSGMVGLPLRGTTLELGLGGLWRLDPHATHGTAHGWPLHGKIAWVVHP